MPTTVTQVRKVDEDFSRRGSEKTCTQRYLVEFSDSGGSADTASTATDGSTSIPSYGSTITRDGTLLTCQSKSARPVDTSPRVFEVDVEFTNQLTIAQDKPSTTETSWDAEVRFSSVAYTEPVIYDLDGDPIVNKAEEFLTPEIEAEYIDEIITITFKTTHTTISTRLNTLRGRINNDEVFLVYRGDFRIFPQYHIRIVQADANPVTIDGVEAWEVTMVWHIRNDNWRRKAINAGYNYKSGTSLYRCRDQHGIEATVPMELNDDGTQWKPGQPRPSKLQFDLYEVFDASDLEVMLEGTDVL